MSVPVSFSITFPDPVISSVTVNIGLSGRRVELRANATHLQWRYTGDAEWTDLVELSEIGETVSLVAEAAEEISSNCLIAFDGAGKLIRADGPEGIPAQGLVKAAAATGQPGAVVTEGPVNGFSGLVPGATYFLGSNGQPTATVPTSGLVQEIGTATAADTLLLAFGPAILLA